jgi:hypothetical protein
MDQESKRTPYADYKAGGHSLRDEYQMNNPAIDCSRSGD